MRFMLLLGILVPVSCFAGDNFYSYEAHRGELRPVQPWHGLPYVRQKKDDGRWIVEPNPFHEDWKPVVPSLGTSKAQPDPKKFAAYQERLNKRREAAKYKRAELNAKKPPAVFNLWHYYYVPSPNYYAIIPQPPIPQPIYVFP